DEPISRSAYNARSSVPAWPAFTNAMEEKQNKMHIFDIRHTSGSLAVWRDHEAYSSKALRKKDTSLSPSGSSSTSPSTAALTTSGLQSTTNTSAGQSGQDQDNLSAALSQLSIACKPTALDKVPDNPSSEASVTHLAQEATPISLDDALNDVFAGLQSHLGPLADFLESTANGLRKIAEKTREADATPVETVLTGFKNIITEVG